MTRTQKRKAQQILDRVTKLAERLRGAGDYAKKAAAFERPGMSNEHRHAFECGVIGQIAKNAATELDGLAREIADELRISGPS